MADRHRRDVRAGSIQSRTQRKAAGGKHVLAHPIRRHAVQEGRSRGPGCPPGVPAFLVDDLLIDTGTIAAAANSLRPYGDGMCRTLVHTHHTRTTRATTLPGALVPIPPSRPGARRSVDREPGLCPQAQSVLAGAPDGSVAGPTGDERTAHHYFTDSSPRAQLRPYLPYEPDPKWLSPATSSAAADQVFRLTRITPTLASLSRLAELDVERSSAGSWA